jgi:hypothetical protein
MKTLGTLLLTLTIFGSSLAFADHSIVNTCLVNPSEANPEFVSAKEVIDEETGLTTAFYISTTYTKITDCMESIRGNLNRPDVSWPTDDFIISSKCYTDIGSKFAFYSVVEKRKQETGVVVELEIINEFDSFLACKASLE